MGLHGSNDFRHAVRIRGLAINPRFQLHTAQAIVDQYLVVGMAWQMFVRNVQLLALYTGITHGMDLPGGQSQRMRHADGCAWH